LENWQAAHIGGLMSRAQAVWSLLALSKAESAPECIRNWIRLNKRCSRRKCQRDSSFSASVKLLFTAETVPHGGKLVFEAFEASVFEASPVTDGYAEC
jgi:hypothetical protein